MELIFLLIIGLIAGTLAGLLGIGGGIIFTPVLFFLFEDAGVEQSVQWSVASGLFCTLLAAGSSTVRQYLQKNMFWREGITLGLLGAIGISIGKLVLTSQYYSREEFVIFFSLILFYAAYMMFKKGRDTRNDAEIAFSDLKFPEVLVTGGIGGFVASLAGVGGGGIMVPIMNLIYKQPFRKAVSVSQLGMTILITTGVAQLALSENSTLGITEFTMGYVDFGAALPLAVGGLFGGFGGAFLNQKINRSYLQWGFAILSVIMASRLLWGVFG
ncbi:MAG: sulfite exporter TauE/SafE family protein [Balneolaceae bacterium]